MTKSATIRPLAAHGMTPREIAAITGYDAATVRALMSQDRERLGSVVPRQRAGRPRSPLCDAMAVAYARCGNYSLVARAFAVAPSNVFEAVQRRTP
jgi:hypothetical protein